MYLHNSRYVCQAHTKWHFLEVPLSQVALCPFPCFRSPWTLTNPSFVWVTQGVSAMKEKDTLFWQGVGVSRRATSLLAWKWSMRSIFLKPSKAHWATRLACSQEHPHKFVPLQDHGWFSLSNSMAALCISWHVGWDWCLAGAEYLPRTCSVSCLFPATAGT